MKYNTEVFVQFENIELKFQYLIFVRTWSKHYHVRML
jgi:hypothetical protein